MNRHVLPTHSQQVPASQLTACPAGQKERLARRTFVEQAASFLIRVPQALVLTAAAFGCGGITHKRQGHEPAQGETTRDYIRLAFNESPYGPPPEAIAAIEEMLSRPYAMDSADVQYLPGINRYPDFLNSELTETLARCHGLKSIHIIPCCGISELLYMCSQAFLGGSRTLVMTEGSFPLLRHYAAKKGAGIRLVPPTQHLQVDLDALLDAVDSDTGIVYLANPDNPTGTRHTVSEIKAFVEAVGKKNGRTVCVIDEAYVDYAALQGLATEALSLVWDYPVVVGRTFSKAYGMAGLRAGYAATREDISGVLNGFLSGYLGGNPGWRMFEGNVNRLAVAAMLASLRPHSQAFISEVCQLTTHMRAFLWEQLLSMGYEPYESHTNFLFVRVRTRGTSVRDWLCTKGILIQAGESFHPRYKEFVRISIGDQRELECLLEALRGFEPGTSVPDGTCGDMFFMGI